MQFCSKCIRGLTCSATLRGIYNGNNKYKCPFFISTTDVTEVVRCPECIYCENMKCTELKDNTGHPLDVATFDYCSQGVR